MNDSAATLKTTSWGKLKEQSSKTIISQAQDQNTSKNTSTEKPASDQSTNKWNRSKELLKAANGSARPQLVRNDSLVVPGTQHRPSVSFSVTCDGRDSPRSYSDRSLGSRRGSSRSLESRFSAIDLSKLQQTQTTGSEDQHEQNNNTNNAESFIQLAIPYLPVWLASVLLVMNILAPGTGTMLSGMSIYCCGQSRLDAKDDQKSSILCTNVFVGCAQLFTVTFMLVGWFWSLTWGIYMVILAVEKKKEAKLEREEKLQALALTAFNPQVRPWTLGRSS